jgi:hypothetical protein
MPGPNIPSPTPGIEVCNDGDGDEVCGLEVGLDSTGSVTITDFVAETGRGILVNPESFTSTTHLEFNMINVTGETGCGRLGQIELTTSDSSEGALLVVSTSEWVDAALGVNSLASVSVPEPSSTALLVSGAVLLSFLFRGRAAKRHPRRAVAVTLFLVAIIVGPKPAMAIAYFDRDHFLAAVGATARHIDFESVPLTSGFSALSNGDVRRQASFVASNVPADILLIGTPGPLKGTFSVFDSGAPQNVVISPGSTNNSDDDVVILFDVPVRAAGVMVVDNLIQAAETVKFYDQYGGLLSSYAMPGGSTGSGGDGFVGYRVRAGERPIASIVLNESAVGSDNIQIDDVIYEYPPEPFADKLVSYSPTIILGDPAPPSRDSVHALDEPDLQAVSLGEGGSIVVQFTDNALTGSGDVLPDLAIYELDVPTPEATLVEISVDGTVWDSLGTILGGTQGINIDSFGFGVTDEFYFVRLTDVVGDGESSGPEVGADIDAVEALSTRIPIADADFDGIPDLIDSCEFIYNPFQADQDGDSVGDFCDNCLELPNTTQDDQDGDGEGDACEPATLRVTQLPPHPVSGNVRAALHLDCGGVDVHGVNVGFVIPQGVDPLTARFGSGIGPAGGCAPPAVAPPGSVGVPLGTGCTANPLLLGPNVDLANSGAFGPHQAGSLPPGARPDALYVVAVGSAANSGKLCSAFESNAYVGGFVAGPVADPGGVGFLGEVSSVAHSSSSGLSPAVDDTGSPTPITFDMTIEGTPADVAVELTPADGEPDEGGNRLTICISEEDTVYEMNRVSFGLGGPEGVTMAEFGLEGCDTYNVPDDGIRHCDAPQIGDADRTVDESYSFTYGPFSPGDLSALGLDDTALKQYTLYVVLEGDRVIDSAWPHALNANPGTPGAYVCIGTVALAPPLGDDGLTPSWEFDGVVDLPFKSGGTEGFRRADSSGTEFNSDSVARGEAFATGYDIDGDTVLSISDNCPYANNPSQLNGGDFESIDSDSDFEGDACECGDGNATGAVFGDLADEILPASYTDSEIIRRHLVGLAPPIGTSSDDIRKICSVHEGPGCDIADVIVLEQAFLGTATVSPSCDAALGDPPPDAE